MTAPGHARRARPGRVPARPARVPVRPTAAQLIDLGFLTGLGLLAVCAFGPTYGGSAYLATGAAGVGLGLLAAWAGCRTRVPVLAVPAVAVAGYFGVGLLLPGPRSLGGLADLPVHGWKQLLTTLPPIGSSGPLLGLPFLLALAASALGAVLALRTRPSFAAAIGPVALFAAVILLGGPGATRGTVTAPFVAGALGWVALRFARTRPTVQHGSRQTTRAVLAVAMLAAAAVGASVIGPGLPLAGANRRVVLRNYVHPPFDVQDQPSPLAGFRKYVKTGTLNDKVLFTATGVPAGVPVRIATLDSYDGLVWGAGDPNATTASTGTFQRVGTSITTTADGPTATVTITIGADYDDVWVPSVGQPSKVRFGGPRRRADTSAFRFNLETSTGVVPTRLVSGDTVTLRTVVPPSADLARISPYGEPTVGADYLAFVQSSISRWSNGVSGGGWPQLQAIAKHLHDDGKYSDGAGDEAQFLPGHSVGRLTTFVSARQLVGDDEQYAALFALMANAVGFPARVVLGALPEGDGTVKGKDVHAWVELRIGENSWATVPRSEFMPDTDKKPDKLPPQQQQDSPASVVPPPNAVHPPSSLDNPDQPDTRVDKRNQTKRDAAVGGGFQIPRFIVLAGVWGGPPLLLILLTMLAIAGGKAYRRRRRRSRGPGATRVAAGWRELTDHARDLGAAVPAGRTRREDARSLDRFPLLPMAASADQLVFGPGETGADAARWYWSEVDRVRREMSRGASRRQRLRAAVSLRSLRRA